MFTRQERCWECCARMPDDHVHRMFCNAACRARSYRRWRFIPYSDPRDAANLREVIAMRNALWPGDVVWPPEPSPTPHAAQHHGARAQRRVYRVPTGTITVDLTDLAVLDLPAPVRAELFAALSQLEALDGAERRAAAQKVP
ncbi:hypothetical protein [Nocardia camponoti]|nr:hypothetical protein [Nocardia camponoti]